MAKITLNDAGLRKITPPAKGQKSYWDENFPSFGVRVSQGGSKTFVVNRNNSLITIGRYGVVTLAEARTEAKKLLAEFTLGKIRPQSLTYSQAVALFLEEKAKSAKPRTLYDYKRLLGRFKFQGQLPELNHRELERNLQRFKSQGEYNHILIALKVFFNWCIKRRMVEHNPTMGLSKFATTPRSRVLTNRELKAIWHAAEAIGGHYGKIVKLLILTGQRKSEIANLQTSYVSDNTICLPTTLTKNKREHQFPVGKLAVSVLASAETGGTDMLFPVRYAKETTKSFNGWSKSKAELDELSGVKNWVLHDLRRTFATRLAEMGVLPHVVERLLNHMTGQVSGVAAIYNRATYQDDMKKAVKLWEAHLAKILA